MIRERRFAAAATLALALALTTACAPDPAPTPSPSPTGFASQEEAFAAAEATYRAYVDALNAVDYSDPATFEAVFALTRGAANAADRKDFSNYHANGTRLEGDFRIASILPTSWDRASSNVLAEACLDVSATSAVDSSETPQSEPARTPVVALSVEFVPAATSTGMAISNATARDGGLEC